MDRPESVKIRGKLIDLYNSTSFSSFVRFVLDNAEEKKCYDISSPCNIDRHFRCSDDDKYS